MRRCFSSVDSKVHRTPLTMDTSMQYCWIRWQRICVRPNKRSHQGTQFQPVSQIGRSMLHVVNCDRVACRVEHHGSQGRVIRHSQLETVAASSVPSSQNRFVPCISRPVRRLRLVSSNNANSVDDSAQSVLVGSVHGEFPQDVPRVAVLVVNMAVDDSESDVRAESVHGDGNPLIRQNTSNTETIDGREESEMGLEDPVPEVEEDEVVLTPPRGVEVRAALEELDRLNPCLIFEQRASLMKKVPKFLRSPFRNALKFALEEAIARDEVR